MSACVCCSSIPQQTTRHSYNLIEVTHFQFGRGSLGSRIWQTRWFECIIRRRGIFASFFRRLTMECLIEQTSLIWHDLNEKCTKQKQTCSCSLKLPPHKHSYEDDSLADPPKINSWHWRPIGPITFFLRTDFVSTGFFRCFSRIFFSPDLWRICFFGVLTNFSV